MASKIINKEDLDKNTLLLLQFAAAIDDTETVEALQKARDEFSVARMTNKHVSARRPEGTQKPNDNVDELAGAIELLASIKIGVLRATNKINALREAGAVTTGGYYRVAKARKVVRDGSKED